MEAKAAGVRRPAPYLQVLGSPDGDQPSHETQHHGKPRRRDQVTGGAHSHTSCQNRIVDVSLQSNSLWVNEMTQRGQHLSKLLGKPVARQQCNIFPASLILKPAPPLCWEFTNGLISPHFSGSGSSHPDWESFSLKVQLLRILAMLTLSCDVSLGT